MRNLAGILVVVLLSALLYIPVSAVDITVDLAQVFDDYDPRSAGQITIFERGRGGGPRVTAFRPRVLTPDNAGNAVVDLAPNESNTEYELWYRGTRYAFRVAADTADGAVLSDLRSNQQFRAQGPCITSTTAPAEPFRGDLWCHPTLGTLAFHADGQWHSISGGSAEIGAGSVGTPELADNAVTDDKLSDRMLGEIRRSLDFDSCERDSGDNVFSCADNAGIDENLDLPGQSWLNSGTQLGTAFEVWEADCTGVGITCSVVGQKVTLSVPGTDLAPLTNRMVEVEALDAALRTTTVLVSTNLTATDRNIGYAITGLKFPVPDGASDGRDIEISYSITPQGESAITGTFLLSALRAKTPVVRGNLAIADPNAVHIVVGSDSYYFGRDTSEDGFFGTSEAGILYSLVLSARMINTTPFLRGVLPRERLCAGAAAAGKYCDGAGQWVDTPTGGGSGGGLTTAQVDARIIPQARAGDTSRWPANKLPIATASQPGLFDNNDFVKLRGIATGAEVNVNADWNAVSGDALILNKPAIPVDTDTDTFIGLTDTPSAYTGQARRILAVNAATNALVYTNGPAVWAEAGDPTTVPYNKLPPLDSIVSLTGQTGSAQGPDRRIGANNNTSTLATFSVGGVDYTLRRLYWGEDDDDFSVFMTAEVLGPDESDANAAIALLAPYHVRINTVQLVFGDATLTSGGDPVGGQNTTTLEWNFNTHLAAAPFGLNSDNVIVLFEPLDSANFVPGNCADGQYAVFRGTRWRCIDIPRVPGARQTFNQLTSLVAPEADDSRYVDPSYFSDFDLRDADKQHGELHATCVITLTAGTTGATANLSFTQNDSEDPRNRQELRSSIDFMSQIRAASSYRSATDPRGLELVELRVYSANTHAGTYWLRLVRTTTSTTQPMRVGLFQWYEGVAGNEGPLTLSSNCVATYTPSDVVGNSGALKLTTQGPLRAKTRTLPTAAVNGTLVMPDNAVNSGWVRPDGTLSTTSSHQLGAGYIRAGGLMNNQLQIPTTTPNPQTNGWWLVSKVGTAEQHRVFAPWGPGALTDAAIGFDQSKSTIFFAGPGVPGGGTPSWVEIQINVYQGGTVGVNIIGQNKVLPANSTIEIYEAGVFFRSN